MKKDVNAVTDEVARQDPEKKRFSFNYSPRSDRYEMGKQMRKNCPRSSHAKWKAPYGKVSFYLLPWCGA
jgi:hypothetical protein